MLSKVDRALFAQQQALGLRAHRQQVLASNIANADTPHYKAMDFDFASTLRDALRADGQGSLAMTVSSPRHLPGHQDAGSPRLLYRQPAQPSADGNTVEMDVESAQLAENSFHYEAGISFLTQQIRTLQAALQAQ